MLRDDLLDDVFANATRNLATVLFGIAACAGLASAQTQFMITSVSSGMALDVTGSSKAPGGSIQQSVPTAAANQLWTIRRQGASFSYEIISVNSGLVLDVPGSSTKPGTFIQQYTPNGGNNQLWQLAGVGGPASYEIVGVNQEKLPGAPGTLTASANLVLDVPASSTKAGTFIQQYTENDGTNQQWLFHAQPHGNYLTGITFTGITASSGPNGPITVNGYGFAAGSEVCPVFAADRYNSWAESCATVASNGTFTYDAGTPSGYQFVGSGAYIVVIIEDKNENVLAIGSVLGLVNPIIP